MEHKILDDDIMILTGEYRNLNLSELAAGREIVELDMGCGKGSFTTELAKRYPDRLILAPETGLPLPQRRNSEHCCPQSRSPYVDLGHAPGSCA